MQVDAREIQTRAQVDDELEGEHKFAESRVSKKLLGALATIHLLAPGARLLTAFRAPGTLPTLSGVVLLSVLSIRTAGRLASRHGDRVCIVLLHYLLCHGADVAGLVRDEVHCTRLTPR
jgi:hypothetical protein